MPDGKSKIKIEIDKFTILPTFLVSWIIHLTINTDATMCGYAVDINGDLVDGVVVEVRRSVT
jgi:hypothetical protein